MTTLNNSKKIKTKNQNNNNEVIIKSYNQQIKNVVKLVQKWYSKFEKGEIDQKGLNKAISNDANIYSTKFEDLMKTANGDKKDFKSIIDSLGIFNKKTYYPPYSNDDLKNSTLKKFPRYIKNKEANTNFSPTFTDNNVLNAQKNYRSEPSNREDLKDIVNKFSKGQMDIKTFENSLKEKNVNPEISDISRQIRFAQNGAVNHKELMHTVLKNDNFKFSNDPKKINYSFRNYSSFEHNKFEDSCFNKTMQVREGQDPLMYGSRKIPHRNPNLLSNKEIFDWEANENGEETTPAYNPGKHKFIIKGRVYQNENNLDVLYNPRKKVNPHPESPGILTWDEKANNRKSNFSADESLRSNSSFFKKRDHNVSFERSSYVSEKTSFPTKKVNCNLYEKKQTYNSIK